MEPQHLQQLGLVLDGIGVSLGYVFGVHRSSGGGIIWPGLGGPSEIEQTWGPRLSHTGFALILAGFTLQFTRSVMRKIQLPKSKPGLLAPGENHEEGSGPTFL